MMLNCKSPQAPFQNISQMENDCETTVTPNRNTIGGSNIKLAWKYQIVFKCKSEKHRQQTHFRPSSQKQMAEFRHALTNRHSANWWTQFTHLVPSDKFLKINERLNGPIVK
jgi:urease accessory protein UreE